MSDAPRKRPPVLRPNDLSSDFAKAAKKALGQNATLQRSSAIAADFSPVIITLINDQASASDKNASPNRSVWAPLDESG